jgi:hypothetical protein
MFREQSVTMNAVELRRRHNWRRAMQENMEMGCTTYSSDWTLTFSDGLRIIFDMYLCVKAWDGRAWESERESEV